MIKFTLIKSLKNKPQITDKKRHKKLSFFLLIYNVKFCYNSNCFIFVPLIDYFETLIDYCNRKMFRLNN